jgi:ABC-type branched-subunit amino acid transport system substrate-binding protein
VSGNQADAVAAKAVEWGVPNITLASRPGLTQRAANIFRLALTPENQIRGLVTYATERLGARRFAILFPEDRFGREFASEYFRIVEEMGGVVAAAESYDPNQSDFRTQIENMTGLGMLAFRKSEAEALIQSLTLKLGREPTRREIEKQAALPPIVDFDVLFIPDTFRAVGQIAPALIYADVTSPILMGPSTWNNSRLLERAGQHLEKSVFVDVFSPERKGNSTVEFINAFQNRKGQLPNAMSAIGYDVGTALKMAFSNGGPVESRDELRSRLEVLGSFDGATGLMNWNSNREALQELQLFQVRRGTFAHQGSVLIPQTRD